jgi:hypothetical protein
MTVQSQISRITQNGDGVTVTFPVSFYFLADGDLTVIVDGVTQTITTGYTVTGAGNPAGGSVTFTTAPASGTGNVVIFRDPDLTQLLDYIENDDFPAESHERGLDKLTMLVQRLNDLVSRSVKLDDSVSTAFDPTLPAINTSLPLLGLTPGGDGLQGYPLGSTPQSAASTVYTPSGTGAVATTVGEYLNREVWVEDFMTEAEIVQSFLRTPILDMKVSFEKAINHCLKTSSRLRLSDRMYYLPTGCEIDNSVSPNWSTLDVEGSSFETGSALSQTGYGRGTCIVTDGNSAFSILFDSFFNESVRFRKMSFYNKGAIGLTGAIIIDKDTVTYPRGWAFEEIGYYNFDSCITLRGNDPSIFNNFFGPMTITKQFPYLCSSGLQLIDAYANLCHIDDSLYFSCSKGGIIMNAGAQALGSGGIFSIRNSHFEGCEPAGIVAGALTTFLTLDNVSGEATGTTGVGYGLIKRSNTIGALTVNVSNSNYGDKGFSLMPSEYRLGRGDVMTASCPVNVSGYGWQTTTPAMVTPVVSNNVTYGQTDVATFCMTPIHSNVGRAGKKAFDKLNGWNSGANINYSPAYSELLPNALRSNFVGVKGAPIYNVSDTMTAPANGYFMASWIASYSATDNGFQSGSDVRVGGTNRVTLGNSFGPYTGNFLFLTPVNSGQSLARCSLIENVAAAWTTSALVTFEPTTLDMFNAACGYPRTLAIETTVANGASYIAEDYGDGATSYAVNVKLYFNGGALGYYEYLVTGDGAVAANKSYTTVASRVIAGIALTTATASNTSTYYITCANTSGGTVRVTKEVTYLS